MNSTENAVQLLAGDVLKSFKSNLSCVAILINLKKVFDIIHHETIVCKLAKLGIEGIALVGCHWQWDFTKLPVYRWPVSFNHDGMIAFLITDQ